MRNKAGAASKAAEDCYSKCVDMSEVRTAYRMAETKERVEDDEEIEETEERNYEVDEDEMSLEQAKRIVQKVKNRK